MYLGSLTLYVRRIRKFIFIRHGDKLYAVLDAVSAAIISSVSFRVIGGAQRSSSK